MKRPLINEIYFIRAIACLCVVLIHSITLTQPSYELPTLTYESFYRFKMVLMFATPLFVMISEFLLSYSYPDRLPKSFWKKRVLYILVPYLMMVIVYSLHQLLSGPGFNWMRFGELLVDKSLLGKWHGYFVAIIFQFYALHFLLKKTFDRFPAFLVISLAFVVNVFYLAVFNFQWLQDISWIAMLRGYYKLPFPGWIFYFTIAFYAGKNIDGFLNILRKYKYLAIPGTVLTASVPLYLRYAEIYKIVSSKRFDIVLYTLFIFVILYWIAQKIKKNPSIILWISSSSYGIYLLHPLIMYTLVDFFRVAPFYTNLGVHILVLFTAGVFGPMLATYLLNKLPYGALLLGKFNLSKSSHTAYNETKVKAS